MGDGPQGDGDSSVLSGIAGREVSPRLRVTPDRKGVVSSLGGRENRPGESAQHRSRGTRVGRPSAAAQDTRLPPRAATQSLRPSLLPSPSGCFLPRLALLAPPSC